MQKRYAYRSIAVGIALTDSQRKQRVDQINSEINELYYTIRSSSDVDGMPHGTTVGNPVSALAVQAERLARVRDAEQERLNAVEWAKQSIRDTHLNGDKIIEAVLLYLDNQKDEAMNIVDVIGMPASTFTSIRMSFTNSILKYLYLK